ncbi:MAG: ABC transporter ATP-binding protein [Loktanella sp.]|nr:ABC transporter ATP-binding protein [Loktanella sp.]
MNMTVTLPDAPAATQDTVKQGASLRLEGLTKRFGAGPAAVAGIDLDVAADEFVVLVGPSGCGKSTTLRLIAGLEQPTAGTVQIAGETVNHLGAAARDVAMVFQNYALYPHMTVAQNIGFGLRRRGMSRADTAEAVAEAGRVLELSELMHRQPGDLSGGQRQRVAMGRADTDGDLQCPRVAVRGRVHRGTGHDLCGWSHDRRRLGPERGPPSDSARYAPPGPRDTWPAA